MLLTLLAAGSTAQAGWAHENDVSTADGHAAEDAVAYTAAEETQLQRASEAATRDDAAEARAEADGPRQQVGEWDPVMEDWPVVAMHVALLPSGKVLAYDSIDDQATETHQVHDRTRGTVWDPATDSHESAYVPGFNIFCSGLSHLTDGTFFAAGGNKDENLNGIRTTFTFDERDRSWDRGADMAAERWYPTVTPQPDGEMLIVAGRYGKPSDPKADTPEVRAVDGRIRTLPGATLPQPLYPWMTVAPDGRTFNSGPDTGLRRLNKAGAGSWAEQGQRDTINRDYGSHVLYDEGKLLVSGGSGFGDPATRDSRIIDINGANPTVKATRGMVHPRRQHNLTVLADGSVLATGGLTSSERLVDLGAGVYPAERWDPTTETWTELAPMDRTRQYHSAALLLPDGRVLSGGGGVCGECTTKKYLERNAEVFSPPYLFAADGSPAPRPVIDAVPAATTYRAGLPIATDEAASIRKVGLVRLGAVTHSNNMEQRYVDLAFTRSGSTITATAPANPNLAQPGMYMLFVVDDKGVPSVSRMVTLQLTAPPANAAPSVGITTPANGREFSPGATVDLAANAADPSGSIAKVTFFRNGVEFAQDATAPYAARWAGVPEGTHALTAVATDRDAATTTSAPVSITVRAPAPAPTGTTGSTSGSTSGSRSPTTPSATATATATGGGQSPDPTPTTSSGGGSTGRLPVLLRDLAVVGTKSSTRRLRFTLARPATVRVTLLRRRAGRWATVPGTRSARLQPGRRSISLRTPWAGRRLVSGQYRVALRAGGLLRTVTFTVR